MYRWLSILPLLLATFTWSHAGTTGKVAGIVRETENGIPLPGANIVLENDALTKTAIVDQTGHFLILNVPAGTYNITCSHIGYRDVLNRGILIPPDLTTTVNFSLMSITLETGQILEVEGKRPLIQKDQTSSVRWMTKEELPYLPVRGYADVTALQSGVTDMDGNLYIRGGRLEEVAYIDGVSQTNLQTGTTSTTINHSAIDQVQIIVGGFEAEYGRVMSGIVNVVTKEGGRTYSGTAEYITDKPTGRNWLKTPSFGYHNLDLSLGGPLLPNTSRVSLFSSGEIRNLEDARPRWGVQVLPAEQAILTPTAFAKLSEGLLPHHGLNGWTFQNKLTFKWTPRLTLRTGALFSTNDRESYLHSYRYDLDHAPRVADQNLSTFANLTYLIGPKTFVTYAVNTFHNQFKSGDGTHFDSLADYGRPRGNPGFDREWLFYSWDQDSTATVRNANGFFIGDEGHVFNEFVQRNSFYFTPIDIDLTSQITPHHQIKMGFDLQWHELRFYRHLLPILTYRGPDRGGFLAVDSYGYQFDFDQKKIVSENNGLDAAKNPILASFYIQDKMEYEGLVVNAGLRYDYLNARTQALRNETTPLGSNARLDEDDLIGNLAFHKFSPRLGIGFPVSDRTIYHLNFGMFYQQPNLENLYVGLDFLAYLVPQGRRYAFGNPNLKPEKTRAWEIGVTHQFSDYASVDATIYFKSVEDLVQITTVPSTPTLYTSFSNQDWGTIKGVEFTLKMNRKNRLSGRLAYALSYSSGTGSSAANHRNIAWGFLPGVVEPPKKTHPLDFDQRHKLSITADYRFGPEDGPWIWGIYPLARAGFNLLLKTGSGFPYTPTFTFNEVSLAGANSRPQGPVNSSKGPWNFQMDLRANKAFRWGRIKADFFVWTINLFNRQNVAAWDRGTGLQSSVYTSTGNAVTTRWLHTEEGRDFIRRFSEQGEDKHLLKELNPMNFTTPRQIRFGMSLGF